jgi:hypothetical protein
MGTARLGTVRDCTTSYRPVLSNDCQTKEKQRKESGHEPQRRARHEDRLADWRLVAKWLGLRETYTQILLLAVKTCTPLSFVSTIEELVERKSSGSGLENREYGRRDPSRRPRGTLYRQKLTLSSLTSGRSLGRYSSLADSGHRVRVSSVSYVNNVRLRVLLLRYQPEPVVPNRNTRWQQQLNNMASEPAGFVGDSGALRAERKLCFSRQHYNTFRLSAHNREVRIFHLNSSTLCYSLLFSSQMSPLRWEQSTEFRNANKTINGMTQTTRSLDSLRENCVSLSSISLIS